MPESENTSLNKSPGLDNLIKVEKERILRNINMTDKEKFLSFAKMLRRQIMLKQAKITHK